MFDAETFKKYLVEWVISCDQPFEEVEQPEFHRLLEYTHTGSKPLNIPHCSAIKDHIMKMGKSTVMDVQNLVKICSEYHPHNRNNLQLYVLGT